MSFWHWFALGPEILLSAPPLAWEAIEVAREEIGNGEVGANNVNPYSDRDGPWCAAFVCWVYRVAATRLQVELPFEPTNGAKRLYRRFLSRGGQVLDPSRAMPGDLICWHRGKHGSWKGHVGLVESVDNAGCVHTIEGNVGRYPAKVRRFVHDLEYERLVGIARLA